MKATASAALSNLRAWWPEVLTGAILAAVGFAGQKDDPLFAIFEGLIVGVAWAMGFRHRHRPIWEVIRKMDGKLDAALKPPAEPSARDRHLHSV